MLIRFSLFRVALLAFLICGALPAQVISGTVFDNTGAVVSGARVILMDQNYIKLSETASSDKGEFSFADLKPGLQLLQVKKPMFQMGQHHVFVKPNETSRAYIVLNVARGADEFDIAGDRPTGVEPNSAAPSSVRAGGKVEGFKRISGTPPGYPSAAAKRGASGTVALFATIKADGAIADITPLGAADPDLEKASIEAVSKWRYEPMKLNGVPVQTQTTVIFNFRSR